MNGMRSLTIAVALAAVILVGSEVSAYDPATVRPAVYVTQSGGTAHSSVGVHTGNVQPVHYYPRHRYSRYPYRWGGHYRPGYYPGYGYPYSYGYPRNYGYPYYNGYPFFGFSIGIPPFHFRFGF